MVHPPLMFWRHLIYFRLIFYSINLKKLMYLYSPSENVTISPPKAVLCRSLGTETAAGGVDLGGFYFFVCVCVCVCVRARVCFVGELRL